jgi:hypothetical protein
MYILILGETMKKEVGFYIVQVLVHGVGYSHPDAYSFYI